MKSRVYTLLFSIFLLATACGNTGRNKVDGTDAQAAATGEGQVLVVDTTASVIRWTGFKPGGSHSGIIKISEGTLTVNGEEATAGSFTIDMNSIVNEDLTDAKMNKMLVDHLKSEDFFEVAKYPQSKFTITKIEKSATPSDSVNYTISGNLKMKDVEKNISFGAKINKEGEIYKAVSVPFSIDRTQWNVKYGSKSLFSELKDNFINDDIELQITIEAKALQ
ncbi:YceI family protein [Dysgonomonas sp. 520]|uniref:YceI family protein n=1 Tax=Dysgonomonas sp. 520 TaxID=2302931 RepID=UPI0013CFAF1D|nr:YceI family protein [Dysgonomonas sp. 520]NDW09761.1 YceI family protein [Dysgonomonas sp. 520]